jgi:hypothetical protein
MMVTNVNLVIQDASNVLDQETVKYVMQGRYNSIIFKSFYSSIG